MRYRPIIYLTLIALMMSACSTKQTIPPRIIPLPVELNTEPGEFALKESSEVKYIGEEAAGVASHFVNMLNPATGFSLSASEGSSGDINLVLDTTMKMQPEEYTLVVGKNNMTLTAATADGLFRGIQTIRQLLPAEIEKDTPVKDVRWTVPCLTINDYPRFSWRGMHLDVSRHFFDVDFIKRYIDLIAMHKMNVFHWHLVDDQGWRIEIKKYPELTEVGAWRVDREDKPWNSRMAQQPGEKATYGGFYTQEQIREIVAYAAERHITVVPEIEMPAHVGSALAAYPEYSCTGGPFTVPPGGVWPIVNIYCAGKEETFAFLEEVLTEVMDLFPSGYIHIGGDEADKTEWKKCPLCQARMCKEGLKDEAELQSYFVRRMERFISSKGRKLIGWDEILEGGLAPGAAVMSWRGFEGGIAAARAGHPVVMSPVSHCYFDYYQADPSTEPLAFGGYTTLKKVYSFEPVPSELTPDEAKYIIGAQANLWTEMISTGSHAEYMVLPRMTALSEVLWSAPESHDWTDFTRRLTAMTERFDLMGINYSKGTYRVDMAATFDEKTKTIKLELLSDQPSPEIRYTTDGSDPVSGSMLYTGPVTLSGPATIKAAIFIDNKPMGQISGKTININKATGRAIKYNIPYSNRYKGSGDITLVNGINGSRSFDDGHWLGFDGSDMDVIVDLGEEIPVSKISGHFLCNVGSWIFLPQWVEYSVSPDGASFTSLCRIMNEIAPEDQGNREISMEWAGQEVKTRFVRVLAKGQGKCPPWHSGAGGNAWLFCDEVVIE